MFSQMAPLMNGKMGAGADMMMRGGGHGGFGGGLGSVFSTVIIVLAVLWVVKKLGQDFCLVEEHILFAKEERCHSSNQQQRTSPIRNCADALRQGRNQQGRIRNPAPRPQR